MPGFNIFWSLCIFQLIISLIHALQFPSVGQSRLKLSRHGSLCSGKRIAPSSLTRHHGFNWPTIPNFSNGLSSPPLPASLNPPTSCVKWPPHIIEDYRIKGKQCSDLHLTSLGLNTRKISASLTVDSSKEMLWNVLTDYNSLASIVPNLVQSYVVHNPSSSIKPRIYQEGAQKVMGFDLKAGLTMEMTETRPTAATDLHTTKHETIEDEWKLNFKCVDSIVFDMFDGEWRILPITSSLNSISNQVKLFYDVTLKPKGPFPVIAMECRIKEDIPVNLFALKLEAERRKKLVSTCQS